MSELIPEHYVPFIDPIESVFIMDPKEAARLAYGYSRPESSYTTLVEKKKELNERRSVRLSDRAWKQNHMPNVDQLIGESLDSEVEPEEPDWSEMDWLTDDINTDGPAPIYYDGPYNPAKEAKLQRDARRAEDQAIMAKSQSIQEALLAGDLTKGQALVALMANTYGREREWLLETIGEIQDDKLFESSDHRHSEFRVLVAAGNLAARRTLDSTPYQDTDYLDGFEVITL